MALDVTLDDNRLILTDTVKKSSVTYVNIVGMKPLVPGILDYGAQPPDVLSDTWYAILYLSDRRIEYIPLGNLDSQPTWTNDAAGYANAEDDIYAAFPSASIVEKAEVYVNGTRNTIIAAVTGFTDALGRMAVDLSVANGDRPALVTAHFIGGSGDEDAAECQVGRVHNATLAAFTVEFWNVQTGATTAEAIPVQFTVIGTTA